MWATSPAIITFKLNSAETVERRLTMDIQQKIDLVTRNSEEVVTPEELRVLLETKTRPKAYWGFECSGQ